MPTTQHVKFKDGYKFQNHPIEYDNSDFWNVQTKEVVKFVEQNCHSGTADYGSLAQCCLSEEE